MYNIGGWLTLLLTPILSNKKTFRDSRFLTFLVKTVSSKSTKDFMALNRLATFMPTIRRTSWWLSVLLPLKLMNAFTSLPIKKSLFLPISTMISSVLTPKKESTRLSQISPSNTSSAISVLLQSFLAWTSHTLPTILEVLLRSRNPPMPAKS